MPFTFSHPAIVLPFLRVSPRWFSATGLVVGSLTPDFEYFLRMHIHGEYGHTLPGIVFFCLPIGLLLAFAFHNLVRDTLFENLPRFLRSRLIPFTAFDWNQHFRNRWYVVIASILLGAASHIFWDAFTHAGGYFVTAIPALNASIQLGPIQVAAYKFLQHLSTLIGGIIVIGAILSLPTRSTSIRSGHGAKYWIILVLIAVFIIAARLPTDDEIPSAVTVIVVILSATLLSLIITPFVMKLGTRRR